MTDEWTAWRNAASFAELCELAAQFVSGDLDTFPGYGGEIDEESGVIAVRLAELNRRGWLTTCSQPGLIDDPRSAQRAFVEGYASEQTALTIATTAMYSDLVIITLSPCERSDLEIPIVTTDGLLGGVGGGHYPDFSEFAEVCNPAAVGELMQSWYIAAIDPQWGRADYLWDVLLAPPRDGFAWQWSPDM